MTRQRTVFPTPQCAHVWAQCNQDEGRNASNSASFVGRLFFSYSTPIAHIIDAPQGARVALVSAEGYSMTTKSKHLTAVWRAVRGAVQAYFTVPYVDVDSRGQYRAPRFERSSVDCLVPDVQRDWREAQLKNLHEQNLAYLMAQYAEAVARYMRAQIVTIDSTNVCERLDFLANQARHYSTLFGLPAPSFKVETDTAAIIARRDRLMNDPQRVAKVAARDAAKERKRLADAKLAAERNAYRIEQFRLGAPNVGYLSDAEGCAMLRLSPDRESVQTSWGASAPIDHVRTVLRFYDFVRSIPAKGSGDYDIGRLPERAAVTLGHFRLERIKADGSVKVGCHTITAREIELLRDCLSYEPVNAERDTREASEIARLKS